jgi:hypothetical protein
MAAPQVAGQAAILRAQHPEWSPGAVASALRTTAVDTDGTASPLRQGSGLPATAAAGDPGLVVEPSDAELTAFAEAAAPDGREVNLPSIALREYDGTQPVRVVRRLTNVSDTAETYQAQVSGLAGMTVRVNPSTFMVQPGATVDVTITLRRGSAPFDRYTTGAVIFAGSAHRVRMTVAARPWGLTPRTYDDTGIEFGRLGGLAQGYLQPGWTGPVSGRTTGYVPVRWSDRQVSTTVSGGVFSPGGEGVAGTDIVVPSDSAGLVVQTEGWDPDANLDLYLYRDGKLLDRSTASWHSNERSWVFLPPAGTYTAYVHVAGTSRATVPYRLGVTVVPRSAKLGNARLGLPDTVERGGSAQLTLKPTGTPLEGEAWAYTELRSGGQVIPGLLVSSQ